MATYTSGRGVTGNYRYDELDRVIEVDYSDATSSVTYTYDARGAIDTRTDAPAPTDHGHDPLGRLTSRSHTANPGGVSYSHDKAGNLASATDVAGTTRYGYDTRKPGHPRGLPSGRRTDTWFNVTSTGYDSTTFAAHTHTDYDASSRITRVWTAKAGNDADRVSDLSCSYASPGTACANAPAAGTDTAMR